MSDPFRPRDEFDDDVHPDSLRGRALALMEKAAEHERVIETAIAAKPRATRWFYRSLIRGIRWWYRIRGAGRLT
jgi:hypothetical protein